MIFLSFVSHISMHYIEYNSTHTHAAFYSWNETKRKKSIIKTNKMWKQLHIHKTKPFTWTLYSVVFLNEPWQIPSYLTLIYFLNRRMPKVIPVYHSFLSFILFFFIFMFVTEVSMHRNESKSYNFIFDWDVNFGSNIPSNIDNIEYLINKWTFSIFLFCWKLLHRHTDIKYYFLRDKTMWNFNYHAN